MKTARKIYAGIAASLLLVATACTNDLTDEPATPAATGDTMLKLELTLDGTRSYTDKTSFSEGDEILVVAQAEEETGVTHVDSCKAYYSNGKWLLEGRGINLNNIGGIAASQKATILAYYPYSEAVKGYSNYWINIKNALNQTDFIAGRTDEVSVSNPTAKISMNHSMARISLNITNPFDEDINVYGMTLSCYAQGELNYNWIYQAGRLICAQNYSYVISDGEAIPDPYTIEEETVVIKSGDTKSIDILLPGTARASSNWNSNGDNSYDTGVKFDLHINGKTYSFKVPHPYWMEGTIYTYNVTLKEAAEQEPTTGEINGYEWVDLGLSVRWATCNIGATSPRQRGSCFQWGDIEPKTSFYQSSTFLNWSIETLLEEGVIEQCTNPDHNGNTMYALTNAFDAASQQWGGGWRMPTVAECKELITGCTWTPYRSGSVVQGYTITGPNGNSITIESAGYYTGKGNYIESGILSLWTSSPYIDNPVASYELGDGYVTYVNRYYGTPIRPVYPKLTVSIKPQY